MAKRASAPWHLYAIGWFGSLWHLDVVAEHLGAEDEQVRQMALAAFERLTNEDFASSTAALKWWSSHKQDFPRWKDGMKAK